jgi:hypothetical protein
MEQKRFGVKKSRIEELRLFQLALKHKRISMAFVTSALVCDNNEYVEKSVTAYQGRRITITLFNPTIEHFGLPRQPLLLFGGTGLLLHFNDCLNVSIMFQTTEERLRFTQTLGDLDPL